MRKTNIGIAKEGKTGVYMGGWPDSEGAKAGVAEMS
jgi:hypothetical protein